METWLIIVILVIVLLIILGLYWWYSHRPLPPPIVPLEAGVADYMQAGNANPYWPQYYWQLTNGYWTEFGTAVAAARKQVEIMWQYPVLDV